MDFLKYFAKPLTSLLILLTIVGCATQNVSNKITRENLAASNKALLVFSITQPLSSEKFGSSLFRFYRNGNSIYAETHDVTGITPNPKSEFANFYGRVGVIEVPAGEYQIAAAFKTGNGIFQVRGKVEKNTVTVKSGEIVYVGALNVKLEFGTFFLGLADVKGVAADLNDERVRDLPIFKAKYPLLGEPEIRLFRVGPIVGESAN